MTASRTRYALVGLGARSELYTRALLGPFVDRAEIVGFCDTNRTRMNYWNRLIEQTLGASPILTFGADEFATMVRRMRVQTVIVTSIDRTHHDYITRAMQLGCDVICEKPMTIDAQKCQQVLDTIRATGRKLTVTFNYRYGPGAEKVKEILASGAIGRVLSVHFEWLLDTRHGADYFRRWHRDKANSGGLLVHKATHHFDLVNWWLESRPRTVYAQGRLAFYGCENATSRGEARIYDRARGSALSRDDPFALDLAANETLRSLYLEAEHEDGYFRDQGVFGDGITTEDDAAVLVTYETAATMSYHLTAYAPCEGLRIAFNGTKGRLEYEAEESPTPSTRLRVRPMWQPPTEVELDTGSGHAQADARMLADIFAPDAHPDPLGRRADHIAGAWSILTGIAANRSMESGLPVEVASLVQF